MSPKVAISIVIPIKNEAGNLPRCLASVAWADEIFVVDSQSADGSQAIAESYGAQVVQFHFQSPWPKKKNWALENLPFKHEWVFILDADEVLPPETESEFRAIVGDPNHLVAGYWINRRFMFMGKWLRHAYYPNWNLRLFKHRLGRYEKLTDVDTQSGDNEVHEHVIVQGEAGYLRSEMDHFAFPSVGVFVEKHNRYSNWEARVALDRYLHGSGARLQKSNVGFLRKLKQLSQSLPFRGLLRFLFVYLWQRGFLDGWEGYYFARLHGFYEFLSVAKTYELKQSAPRESGASFRRIRSAIVPLLFGFVLAAVLYLALVPNVHGDIFRFFPEPVRGWCGEHDDFNNVAAFGVLGFLSLRVGRGAGAGGALPGARLRADVIRVAAVIGLICAIEIAQIWIPGRASSLRDVATGSSGVLAAWLLCAMVDRLGRKPAKEPAPLMEGSTSAPNERKV